MNARVPPLRAQSVDTLLDVVLGVIVALPMPALLEHALSWITDPNPHTAIIVCLSTAALAFALFYWLEARQFLDEQEAFNEAIKNTPEGTAGGVPVLPERRLVGGLAMMVIAAGVLKIAEEEQFRWFMLANVLYWGMDCLGTVSLKREYRPFVGAIARLRAEQPDAFIWYDGHMTSSYFYLYGLGNVLVYLCLWDGDIIANRAVTYRVCAAVVAVAFALFRHLYWRSRIYWWWVLRRQHMLLN